MSRRSWKARLPSYYRESRARRLRPSDIPTFEAPVESMPDALVMSGGPMPDIRFAGYLPEQCGKKKTCRCDLARRWVRQMDAICGDKDDPMWVVELRSARCRQWNLIHAAACRRMPIYPDWWWEIRSLVVMLRKYMEPVRKLEGGWHAGCSGPYDPDAGSYRTIAVRALEDCR